VNFYFSIVNVSIAQIFRGLNGTGTDKHEESTDRGTIDDGAELILLKVIRHLQAKPS